MAARDWRNPADYADLAGLDLAGLAWEFLRRNPDYRRGHASGLSAEAAAAWGLRFPLDPEASGARAPLFWRAEAAPAHVLLLVASDGGGATGAQLRAMALAAISAEEGVHLRFAGGLQAVAPAGAAPDAPLAACLPLDAALAARVGGLAALARLLAGLSPGGDPLSPQGRARAVQMVRALDARDAGASYRQVAEGILGRAEGAAWRTSAARDVAIRLCRAARRLMTGGYRGLLVRRR
jgi:hypothetical protein